MRFFPFFSVLVMFWCFCDCNVLLGIGFLMRVMVIEEMSIWVLSYCILFSLSLILMVDDFVCMV